MNTRRVTFEISELQTLGQALHKIIDNVPPKGISPEQWNQDLLETSQALSKACLYKMWDTT